MDAVIYEFGVTETLGVIGEFQATGFSISHIALLVVLLIFSVRMIKTLALISCRMLASLILIDKRSLVGQLLLL